MAGRRRPLGAWGISRRVLCAGATGNCPDGRRYSRRQSRHKPRCKWLQSPVSPLVPVSFNHAIILRFGRVLVHGTRVTFAAVLSYRSPNRYTPRSGMFSRASLKRVVKIRHADRKRQFDDLSLRRKTCAILRVRRRGLWSRRASRGRRSESSLFHSRQTAGCACKTAGLQFVRE